VCSVTCGNGTQIRFRNCNNPLPQFGGATCPGLNFSTVNCVRARCPAVGEQYFTSSDPKKVALLFENLSKIDH